jgi:hypothetical protein
MVKLNSPFNIRLLFLLLLPCVLFGSITEFTRNIKDIDFLPSVVSAEEPSESGGIALFISESLVLCGQPLAQHRSQSNRLWKQFLSLIVFVLSLNVFNKATLLKYYLQKYSSPKFFHTLIISLLLGGRAPPRPAY